MFMPKKSSFIVLKFHKKSYILDKKEEGMQKTDAEMISGGGAV